MNLRTSESWRAENAMGWRRFKMLASVVGAIVSLGVVVTVAAIVLLGAEAGSFVAFHLSMFALFGIPTFFLWRKFVEFLDDEEDTEVLILMALLGLGGSIGACVFLAVAVCGVAGVLGW